MFTKWLISKLRLQQIFNVFGLLLCEKPTILVLMKDHYTRMKQIFHPQISTGMSAGPDKDEDQERGVVTKTRPKTKKPSQYRVILMNDDYTPMEFVVGLLMGLFKKTQEEATRIMLDVHKNGIGVCGIYTFEVAETKVAQVLDLAKRDGHPLKCTLEKA